MSTKRLLIFGAHSSRAPPCRSKTASSKFRHGLLGMCDCSGFFQQRRRLSLIVSRQQPDGSLRRRRPFAGRAGTFSSQSSRDAKHVSKFDSQWKIMTSRLLEVPVGSYSALQWHEAEEALKYWMVRGASKQAVAASFQLLGRLAQEPSLEDKGVYALTVRTDLLNGVVNNWRKLFKEAPKMTMLPSQVGEKIDLYQQAQSAKIRADARTYAMIFDAASHVKNPKEGVLFCDHRLSKLLDDYSNGSSWIRPDVVTFGSVIHAWSKSDSAQAPKRASEWLKRMQDLHHEEQWSDLVPNVYIYSSVISAWAKVGDAPRAEKLLEDMMQRQIEPDIPIFNSVLSAWSHSHAPDAAERSESILMKMRQWHHSGRLAGGPNVISYSIVLNGWAKSRHPNAARRAHALLKQMQDLYTKGEGGITPNTVSYNMVIAAYSRAGNAQEAESLLRQMLEEYDRGNVNVKPDVRSFSSVLAAWARSPSKGPVAAERAEALLRWMQELYDSKRFDVKPNLRCYSSIIACWAKASPWKDAAKRAEGLLEEMKRENMCPDVVSYTTAMNAWARAGKPHRAERLLEELFDKYMTSQNPQLKPNVRTFSTVLSAWSKTKSPAAAERAEAVLTRMRDLHESKTLDTKPNVVSYSTVLNCWAKSPAKDAAERAQKLFDLMQNSKDKDIQPNVVAYSTIIKAHANVGNAEQAERLFEQMLAEYRGGNKTVKPDLITLSSVLYAWSKSETLHAAEQAETTLANMQRLHSEGVIDWKPNVVCYSSLLACWARSPLDAAAERAESILHSMSQPNLVCYNTVINAWANRCTDSPDSKSVDQAQALWEELTELAKEDKEMTPDAWTYYAMLKAIGLSSVPDKQDRARKMMVMMRQHGVEPTLAIENQIKRIQK